MRCVVPQANTAATEEHVNWNEKLKKNYEFPDWNYIGRPKQEESVQHVQGTSYSNYAPTYVGFALNVEKFMQSFLLRLFLEARQDIVKSAVECNNNQYKHIAIEAHFVNYNNEAETLH